MRWNIQRWLSLLWGLCGLLTSLISQFHTAQNTNFAASFLN